MVTRVWLDRALVRDPHGCLIRFGHLSLVRRCASWLASSLGLSHCVQKGNPVLKVLHTLGQSHEQAATS